MQTLWHKVGPRNAGAKQGGRPREALWKYVRKEEMRRILLAKAWIAILIPMPVFAAKVIGISDGDTLTVLEESTLVKIRLANIDAPEKAQPFGQRSKESLSELCFGKDANYQVQDIDRYGRTVAVVTCSGVQANRAQVDRGLAWVYPKYNRDESLPPLQQAAQAGRRGLFADPAPVPPWEWRRTR